jgi:hypothetical protein
MRGSVELRARMTDDERSAIDRLLELARETGSIEEAHAIVLQHCRNFLGYVEMALHDGSFEGSVDWFIDDTSRELDELVLASPASRAYRSPATSVAAHRRVRAV